MTHRAIGLVKDIPAKFWNVAMARKNPRAKNRKQEPRRNQMERAVPSSANWKPTNAFMRRQQYVAASRPV